MNELHLFAGIGGGILGGLLLGHVPVCAVEIDPYCRKVLRARQADGLLPDFPILEDVRQFDARAWRGRVDVVCGGFPCQPWSTAGKRLGTADPRHLWPEMARVVAECRPRYVFAENVSLAAFAEPWRDLRGLGYRVPPALCLAAADVGAPHLRKRWWLLAADAEGTRLEACDGQRTAGQPGSQRGRDVPDADRSRMHQPDPAQHEPRAGGESAAVGSHGGAEQVADPSSIGRGARRAEPAWQQGRLGAAGGGGAVADPSSVRVEGEQLSAEGREAVADADWGSQGRHWWTVEPRVGRVAHGVPARVDQLKALGNAQVPAVAAAAFRELMMRLEQEVAR